MFAILAILCFLLITFGVPSVGSVDLLPLGLAFLSAAVLVGNWPIGAIMTRSHN